MDNWRKPLRKAGNDPFGDEASEDISKKKLDGLLVEGDPEAAGIVQGAIEDFAQELALIIRRFLKLKAWRDTERIVVGGGFRGSRVGELAIGRTSVILKADKVAIDLVPIRHEPDEAGLIGAAHLAPKWMFEAHDAILAVDIGGTNIRAGVVCLNLKDADDLSKAEIGQFELWRHGDEKPSRDEAVDSLIGMLKRLTKAARKDKLELAPFIGIGCPGRIDADGSIEAGGQNLPGNWESSAFNLPAVLHAAIPEIGEHETRILMHNDAVVQGLSEASFMRDVDVWAAFTIGTGLGNTLYKNREQ
jgi:predicted NBD/HSP70 family sugar kinase